MAAAPTTPQEFVQLLCRSQLVPTERLRTYLQTVGRVTVADLADRLVGDGLLTRFQVGQLLNGRWRGFFLGPYRLLEPIASGGMSRVLLAEHTALGRRVALKVTTLPGETDELVRQRSQREGRAIASLDHPNVVRAFDMGTEGSLIYLAMEYVAGESLASLVSRGPLSVALAADCIRQAALGLQHAHDSGWIHRDIKPSNLLRTPGGVVKLLDLGLARPMLDTSDLTRTYEPKNILGTLDFLSPEQIRRLPDVDGRSDIYGLGATFYFLLTGRPPFDRGKLLEKLLWHLIEEPQPIRELRPDVPEALAQVIHRMLAKEPASRYQRPAEVAEILAQWSGEPPTAKRSVPVKESANGKPKGEVVREVRREETAAPAKRKASRRGLGWVVATVGLLLVLGGATAGVFWWSPWSLPRAVTGKREPNVVTPPVGGEWVGKQVTVEMQVLSVGASRSGSLFYLNSEEDFRDPRNFTVVVPRETFGQGEADADSVRRTYQRRRIQAVGVVFRDRQQLRLEIDQPERLRLLPQP